MFLLDIEVSSLISDKNLLCLIDLLQIWDFLIYEKGKKYQKQKRNKKEKERK